MGSALLWMFLAANPPLTVAERVQLAAPLIEATRVVRQALAAKKIVCVPAVPFDESKPENWLPPEPTAQAGSRQPMNWSRLFNCNSALGRKQLAIQIYESAAAAPKDRLVASGPGFYLRDFGDYSELALGSLVLFDVSGAMPEPSAPPDGLVFDGPRAVSVGAEVADWLRWIPRRELLAVLARSTLPEGARPPPVRPCLPPLELLRPDAVDEAGHFPSDFGAIRTRPSGAINSASTTSIGSMFAAPAKAVVCSRALRTAPAR